jgi:hypothetical protein
MTTLPITAPRANACPVTRTTCRRVVRESDGVAAKKGGQHYTIGVWWPAVNRCGQQGR